MSAYLEELSVTEAEQLKKTIQALFLYFMLTYLLKVCVETQINLVLRQNFRQVGKVFCGLPFNIGE